MRVKVIESVGEAGVEVYARLTEGQVRAEGLFIVESPKVIDIALREGWEPVSMLCEERHIEGDAAPLLERCPEDMPVYTGKRELLAQLTGYTLTRGVLMAFHRKPMRSVDEVLRDARRVAVIAGVVDNANMGSIFRAAAALGIDAVAIGPGTCDPLNRRAVRVSMGTVFVLPWTMVDDPVGDLEKRGLATVAMALTSESVSIDDPTLNAEPRLAIILGNEGDGLPDDVIRRARYTAKIPMARRVDSLNVASAGALAFWQLRI